MGKTTSQFRSGVCVRKCPDKTAYAYEDIDCISNTATWEIVIGKTWVKPRRTCVTKKRKKKCTNHKGYFKNKWGTKQQFNQCPRRTYKTVL